MAPAGIFLLSLFAQARFFFIQQLEKSSGWNGSTEQPALCVNVLVACAEVVCLNLCLDAFNDNSKAECLRHRENLRKNRDRHSIGTNSLREGFIDLDGVDRKIVQISEARIAGAEIVDGNVVAAAGEDEGWCCEPPAGEPCSSR